MNTPVRATPRAEAGSGLDDLQSPEAPVRMVLDGLLGDVRDLEAEVRQLQQALVTRAPIDQAKGVLMLRYGVDADAAFRILMRWSSVSNVKLRVLAQRLVEAASHDGLDPDIQSVLVGTFCELEDLTKHVRTE